MYRKHSPRTARYEQLKWSKMSSQNGLKYNFMAADFFVAIIFFILPPIAKNIN